MAVVRVRRRDTIISGGYDITSGGTDNHLMLVDLRKKGLTGKAAEAISSGDSVKGIGCCPGVVRAQVRVVRDPKSASLKGGEILVAERTDPGWIMLFPVCAGLLVERGSLLSHSAIVAREMGIPAIVSIPGVMSWARDGEWVEMDGATGVARKIAGRAAGA